jgi:hypothetical protein
LVAKTPDKANANLRGRLTLPLSDRHPDYAALQMANYIFGPAAIRACGHASAKRTA